MNVFLNNRLETYIDEYSEGLNNGGQELLFFALETCIAATLNKVPEDQHEATFDEDTLRIAKAILNREEFVWYGTLYSR